MPSGTSTSPNPLKTTVAITGRAPPRRPSRARRSSRPTSTRLPSIARAIARFMRRPANAFVASSTRLESRVDAATPPRRAPPLRAPRRRCSMRACSPGCKRSASACERLARRRQDAARLDAVLGEPALLEVLFAVIERVDEHLLDRGVVEAVARLDAHGLLDARRQLLRVHAAGDRRRRRRRSPRAAPSPPASAGCP